LIFIGSKIKKTGVFWFFYQSMIFVRIQVVKLYLRIIAGTGPGAGQRITRSPTGRWHRTR
jgi:hypothetical protein